MDNKRIQRIAFQVLIGFGAVLFMAVMLAKRFLYFQPSNEMYESAHPYENITHGHLHARFFKKEGADKVIIYCHGNAGNISTRDELIGVLLQTGCSVLAFDYSGYGLSKGIPTEQRCYDDASVFVSLLRQTYKPNQIIMYGQSIGAPVAIYVARRFRLPYVIILSALPSIKSYIREKFSWIAPVAFLFHEFDANYYAKNFPGKILMIHSSEDEMIPESITMDLQAAAHTYIPTTGGHNSTEIPIEKITEFIQNECE